MVKKILFLLFIVFSITFGQVNDSRNYLKENDKQEIEKKISDIESKNDITYYVNLGKKIDDTEIMEKTIILNLIPDGKNVVNAELKFTQDIDTSPYEEKIENVLVEGEVLVTKKQYKEFILSVLDTSEEIMADIKTEKIEVEKKEVKGTLAMNKFAVIIILLLVGLAIFVTLKFINAGKRGRKRRM